MAGVFIAKEFGEVIDVEFAIDDLFNIDLVDPWPTLCNIGKGEGIITESRSRSKSCWYWCWNGNRSWDGFGGRSWDDVFLDAAERGGDRRSTRRATG